MKKCARCKKHKPLTEFYKNRARKDKCQSSCKECDRERNLAYYHARPDYCKARVAERKRPLRLAAQKFMLAHLQENPCADCGEADPLVLEYDHVRGVKKQMVSRMVDSGYPIGSIQTEMDKCEVRCSNCHRRKTWKERNTWMVQLLEGVLLKEG